MILGKRVNKTYFGEPVLHELEFKIGNNRKIGIVGKNGCGKTTLLKLIAEEETTTEGTIEIQGEVVGYIPQELEFQKGLVGELLESNLEGHWEFYKAEMLVSQLNYENFDPYQEVKTLSEGQKMKLKLIETLLKEPTVLLIDEPTNHLDIEGIHWFEEYIKNLHKTVVMISHDRTFLNNTVDEIWEIEKSGILKFVGDYDYYKGEKLRLIDKWDQEYVLFLKHKAKLERLLDNARKIKGDKRGRAVRAAKKRIDREVVQNSKEKYATKVIKSVEFDTDTRSSKLMVRFDNVTKNYGAKNVFTDLTFEVRGKEKVWLFGPNGGGKSTLVKLIMGEEQPTSGNITIGENMRIGYFAQKQTHLDYDKSLLDHFLEKTNCGYDKAFGMLGKFLFDKDAIKKRVRNLSPGERARFAFAIFATEDYDMLILDEPTNHLDIDTKEVIEKSLSNYEGTLLLVSHDRYFVESVGVEKLLNLREGTLEIL